MRSDFELKEHYTIDDLLHIMLTKFKQTSDDKMSDIKHNLDTKRGSSRRSSYSK